MIVAAGVLCFSTCKNITKVLLARESGGKERGKWSTFGGKIEENEQPHEGAAREFYEESMGLITSQETMTEMLKTAGYLDTTLRSGKTFRCYLVELPVDLCNVTDLQFYLEFKKKREEKCDSHLTEKDTIKWFNVSILPTLAKDKSIFRGDFASSIDSIVKLLAPYSALKNIV